MSRSTPWISVHCLEGDLRLSGLWMGPFEVAVPVYSIWNSSLMVSVRPHCTVDWLRWTAVAAGHPGCQVHGMHVRWNNAVMSLRTRDVLPRGNPCGYVGYWSWRFGHPVHWSSGHLSCCRVAGLIAGILMKHILLCRSCWLDAMTASFTSIASSMSALRRRRASKKALVSVVY